MFSRGQKIFILIMIVIIILSCITIGISLHECKENMAIVETPAPTDELIEPSVEPSSDVEIVPSMKDTIEPATSEEPEQEDTEETTESEYIEESPNIAITIEPIPDIEVDVEYIEIEDLLD